MEIEIKLLNKVTYISPVRVIIYPVRAVPITI